MTNTPDPFIAAVVNHKWEAIPLLQAAPLEDLLPFLTNNLEQTAEIHRFLALFGGELDKGYEFLRGMLIGYTSMILAESQPKHLPYLFHQIMLMVATLTVKDVDILTGKSLKEENEKRTKNGTP